MTWGRFSGIRQHIERSEERDCTPAFDLKRFVSPHSTTSLATAHDRVMRPIVDGGRSAL